ncbi:MAG: TRAM domain-containing protein [Proteobacteria bacterium]|nr:TRAM domain-containing protein [Pseudomonadota bacterium]
MKLPQSRRKQLEKNKLGATQSTGPITLRIDNPAFGGDGIGRLDGKVYFVADALPEQMLSVEITEDKGRFAKARPLKCLEEAPYAIPEPCPYAHQCGGFQWQKVPYLKQLEWKAGFIRDSLQRIGGFPSDSYKLSMEASPENFHYRNRISLKCEIETDGRLSVGYFARSSHTLVPVNACLIAEKNLSDALSHLNSLCLPAQNQTFLGRLDLQEVETEQSFTLLISAEEWPATLWRQLIDAIKSHSWLTLHLSPRIKDFVLLESWQGLQYFTKAAQFQQVNLKANHLLRAWVQARVKELKIQTVLDLYCGSGNLSLALAADGLQVFGIEAFTPSIEVAHHNQRVNSIKTAVYKAGEAADIPSLFPELPRIDLILADPPRRGMAEALEPILKLRAQYFIYVSCDPNTLARDLKQCRAAGYQLVTVLGLDFFPHSYHVETVCLLQL